MWASKWVFAWLFVDRDRIVDSVRNQVEFRTGGDYEGVTGHSADRVHEERRVLARPALGTARCCWPSSSRSDRPCGHGVSSHGAIGGPGSGTSGCAWSLAAVPFALWYVALNNHNQIHVWLTYRSVAVAVGALAAFAFATLRGRHLVASLDGQRR